MGGSTPKAEGDLQVAIGVQNATKPGSPYLRKLVMLRKISIYAGFCMVAKCHPRMQGRRRRNSRLKLLLEGGKMPP